MFKVSSSALEKDGDFPFPFLVPSLSQLIFVHFLIWFLGSMDHSKMHMAITAYAPLGSNV